MRNKNQGFNFQLVVNTIDSVKPRESGDSIINGEEVVWGHAVKIKTRNIELREDKDYGFKEVETTLEIEISCDTKAELIDLNKFMLDLKTDNKAFPISTTLPSGTGTDRSAKATIKGAEFIKQNKK